MREIELSFAATSLRPRDWERGVSSKFQSPKTLVTRLVFLLAIGPLHDPVRSSSAVGLPKQRQVQVDWHEWHCFGSTTVQLAHQHV